MNQTEVEARFNPQIICNNCKFHFNPYPESFAPIIDEVICPTCGTKRILYYGEDSSVVKTILTTYGVNKELNERLDRLENQIGSLKDVLKTSLDDARRVMTETLADALKEQINEHEKAYHDFGGKHGK